MKSTVLIILCLLFNNAYAHKIVVNFSGIKPKYRLKQITYGDSIIDVVKKQENMTFIIDTDSSKKILKFWLSNNKFISIDFSKINFEQWDCKPSDITFKKMKQNLYTINYTFCEAYTRTYFGNVQKNCNVSF